MITNYDIYLNRIKLTEALRSFPLYLSQRLRNILSNIDHEISDELLSMHSDLDSRVGKTFIDIHEEKSDYITFTQPNKVVQVLDLGISDDDELASMDKDILSNRLSYINDDNDVYKRYRSEFKLGRLITELFGSKYPNSLSGGQNKRDIESFVNLYKALYTQDEKFSLLELVSGDDISYWYDYRRYNERTGSLGGSCMQSVDRSYFDIYTKNPDKVSMLVLFADDTKSKISGRAIVWKLDTPENRIFMDRVYVNDYSNEQLFINWAKSNGWYYKCSQSMGSDVEIVDSRTDVCSDVTMMIILKDIDYNDFPYCDTMTYFTPSTKELSNTSDYNYRYQLTSTDGGYYNRYEDEDGDEYEPETVWSNYHNQDIIESEAKFCHFGQDWVRSNVAIKVYNTGGGERLYAVPGNPDIALQHFTYGTETMNKHFPKNRCKWSDYLNTWLFEDSVVNVWLNKEKTEVGLDHKKRKDKNYFEIDGENYSLDLVDTEKEPKVLF